MLPGPRYEIKTAGRADLPGWERVYVGAVRNLVEIAEEALDQLDRLVLARLFW